MKKKILFLSDVPDFKGGAENSLFDLLGNPNIEPVLAIPEKGAMSRAAEAKGIQTVTIDYGKVLTVRRPFKFLDIPRTFFSAFSAARQLKKTAKKLGADYVHSNGLKAHGVACFARVIGGKPVFAHFRAIPFTKLEKMFWKAVRLLSRRVILVSRPCWPGETLPDNVKVVFNGIRVANDTPPERNPGTPFRLGFAGRIQYTKGVDTLIEWFDYAYKRGLDIRLVIRGEAAPDEKDYEERVRKMVADRGLEDICVFEGKVDGVENVYKGIDANVVSSVVPDPLPRSVMEACAVGMPAIGYPAGGIPYMIEDGKSGFLVDNAEKFYETVSDLIEDAGLYKAISEGAFRRARENFTLTKLHQSITHEYEVAA